MALQIRRGTDAERQSITPAEGELIYATDTNQLFVGGKISPSPTLSQGGILVSGALVNDTNPTLSSNLDLNGNDITGTGNISVNGNITATGNINLGDGVEDNVIVGGQIRSDLIPGLDGMHDLGAAGAAWKDLYAVAINVETTASVGNLEVINNIISPDSSVILDVDNLNLTINNATMSGNIDMGGNLISNSTVVYNSTTGDITAGNIDATGNLTVTNNVISNEIITGNITSTGDITSNTMITDSITAGDGILEVTGSIDVTGNADVTGTLVSGSVLTGSITGDLTGSVFSDDSTLVIDGITGDITTNLLTTSNIDVSGGILTIKTNSSTASTTIGVTGGTSNALYQNLQASRGSVDAPVDTQPGDFIGGISVAGWYDGVYKQAGQVAVRWDTNATLTADNPGSIVAFITNNNSAGLNIATFNSAGTFAAPTLQTGTYADPTARDAAITTPAAGMIVFLTDSTGAGGAAKHQGYDGSSWNDLY